MTYRELKSELEKFDDNQLDKEVLFIAERDSGVPCNDDGEIDYSFSFRVAESNMYKSHVGMGPCGMSMSESLYPASEIDEDFEEEITDDDRFVKAYDSGTPYFLVGRAF